jgi:hypothetical protein
MDPPYRQQRDMAERLRLMRDVFLPRPDWVLSGSLDDWGGPIIALFDLVVFLQTPTEIHQSRLGDRETRRVGRDAVAPGGWRHAETEAFIEWASHYDDGTREGRNLPRHLVWLAALTCQVLRLDGTPPIPDLVNAMISPLAP